jgi:diguanylate cyclase
MNNDIDLAVRSPAAYALAKEALGLMEVHGVWPTPLNYELWLYVAADPQCPLAQEITRLLAAGEKITEDITDTLAAKYISRLKLSDEVRDAGLRLTRELEQITEVISDAQTSQRSYSLKLEGAAGHLKSDDSGALRAIVENLTEATRVVIEHHGDLHKRLSESSREVNRLRKHLDQVRMEAMTDALTNLANRKSFDEQLDRMCEKPDHPAPLTLAVVDIDHFKRFNDTWGHQTGDQVIRYVASVLARIGREPRLAARYGGEEFGLLFPGESMSDVREILDEARKEISSRVLKRRSTNEDLGTVSISVGLAEREYGEDSFSLMDRADTALYASKNNGRNLVSCAPPTAIKDTNAA